MTADHLRVGKGKESPKAREAGIMNAARRPGRTEWTEKDLQKYLDEHPGVDERLIRTAFKYANKQLKRRNP